MWLRTAEHQEPGVLYLHEEASAMNSIPSVVSARWLGMRVNECPWSGQDDKGTGPWRTGQADLDLAKAKLEEAVPIADRINGLVPLLETAAPVAWRKLVGNLATLRRQLPHSANQMNAFHQRPHRNFLPAVGMSISLCSLR
jgi:hypothetical protein